MVEVRKTDIFARWLDTLKDRQAKARILVRIDRMERGNFGDTKPVDHGINEMRIFYGQGYRVYFVHRGQDIVILLSGGDKSTQQQDIIKARKIADQLKG